MKTIVAFIITLLITLQVNARTKYIVVSFDGSRSLKMWNDTLNFAKKHNIHFTYFISAPYLVTTDEIKKHPYRVMGRENYSWLKFETDVNVLKRRVLFMDRALREGNTLGSHSVGHFYGEKFTDNDWKNELSFFKWAVDSRKEVLGLTNIILSSDKIIGYRAPNLSMNSNGYYWLEKFGYKYDASLANPNCNVRHRFNSKMPIFPLSMLNIVGKKTVILMDYNFYFWDSGAKPIRDEGMIISYTQKYKEYLLDEFLYGRRQVIIVGNHFSLWNGSAYWNGLKEFILTILNNPEYKKNAKFITMDDLYEMYKEGMIADNGFIIAGKRNTK